MKRIAYVFVVLSLFAFSAQSQNLYTMENLQQASAEELDMYLNKAMNLQQAGKTVTIVGGVVIGTTVLSSLIFADALELGVVFVVFFGGLAGLSALAVGIPMNITGKKRVERIESIQNSAFNSPYLRIKPYTGYDSFTKNYHAGLTLGITF